MRYIRKTFGHIQMPPKHMHHALHFLLSNDCLSKDFFRKDEHQGYGLSTNVCLWIANFLSERCILLISIALHPKKT